MWGQKLFMYTYTKPRGERKLCLHVTPNRNQLNQPEAADGGRLLHKLVVTITCKNIIYGCSIRGPLVFFFPNAKFIWHERGLLVLMNQFQQRMMPSIAPTIHSNSA